MLQVNGCHSCAGRNLRNHNKIPACAGMTYVITLYNKTKERYV